MGPVPVPELPAEELPVLALEPFAPGRVYVLEISSYQIDLAQGFEDAKSQMEGPIRNTILRDIGGDEQRSLMTGRQRAAPVGFAERLAERAAPRVPDDDRDACHGGCSDFDRLVYTPDVATH